MCIATLFVLTCLSGQRFVLPELAQSVTVYAILSHAIELEWHIIQYKG